MLFVIKSCTVWSKLAIQIILTISGCTSTDFPEAEYQFIDIWFHDFEVKHQVACYRSSAKDTRKLGFDKVSKGMQALASRPEMAAD